MMCGIRLMQTSGQIGESPRTETPQGRMLKEVRGVGEKEEPGVNPSVQAGRPGAAQLSLLCAGTSTAASWPGCPATSAPTSFLLRTLWTAYLYQGGVSLGDLQSTPLFLFSFNRKLNDQETYAVCQTQG